MGAAYITGLWTVALPAWHEGELRARAFRTGGRGPGHRAATRERTLSRRGGGAPRTARAAGRWGRRPASHPGPARGGRSHADGRARWGGAVARWVPRARARRQGGRRVCARGRGGGGDRASPTGRRAGRRPTRLESPRRDDRPG